MTFSTNFKVLKKRQTLALLLTFCGLQAFSQNGFFENLNKEVRLGLYSSSSKKTPYLNKVNQYGLVPTDANTLYINGAIWKNYDSTRNGKLSNWGYSYGLETQINAFSDTKLLLPVAHISGRFKGLELYAGRKREFFGLADTTGVFRSYIWPGNAMPIPKFQISTPNYIPLIGKGFLSTKMGFAHGWFGNQKYTEDYYLHQKWLFLKVGRDNNLINFVGGLNHFAQWGGYSETLKNDTTSTVNGYFAGDFLAYANVVIPLGIGNINNRNYTFWELANRFGNHVGSLDMGIDVNANVGKFSLYKQTPWEGDQAKEVFFSWDGNYTLMFKPNNSKNVSKIGVEVLSTQRQGYEITKLAKFFGVYEKNTTEFQNYFNHGQYLEGWSYNDNGLGTGAIVSNSDRKNPDKNFNLFTKDNNVFSVGASVTGRVPKGEFDVRIGVIKSNGLGRGDKNNSISQFTSQLSYTTPLEKFGLDSRIDVGIDRGELYGNQIGLNFALIKRWN